MALSKSVEELTWKEAEQSLRNAFVDSADKRDQ